MPRAGKDTTVGCMRNSGGMLAGTQPRKSLRLCLAGLRIRCFDPIAEASQLSDHSRRSLLPRLFGDRGAAFFVTNPLMQDQPDKSTLSMGNGSDRLVVSQAWDRAAIHNFEDASLGPGSSVGRLVEKAPHEIGRASCRETCRSRWGPGALR